MNMILHCTICDDNPSAVKREKEIAERAFCEMNISADISVYTDSSQFMFELGDNKQMDILILDIEMPKMSGFVYPEVDESVCIDCGLCEKIKPELSYYFYDLPCKLCR